MSKIKIGVAVGLSLLVLVLIVQNTEVVAVRILFWEFQMSRVILILMAAFAGFVSGYLTARILDRNKKDPGIPVEAESPGP